jgi:hypothetical protein
MDITRSDELRYSPVVRDTSSSRVIPIIFRSLNNIPTIIYIGLSLGPV